MPGHLSIALVFAAFLAGSVALPACHKGPAEKAGERVDDTINQATEGHTEPMKKGPAQSAGEKIDKATGQ